ncbi:MAG: HU family DNA-binding protein [Candidatus Ratteibacteria bacterium]|nr:HU family DNA-binding protein [Candidatus Ratteibacteria bacterium]
MVRKRDLIVEIARETGITQEAAKAAVESFFQRISHNLSKNRHIELRNWGIFKVKKRKGHLARNPKTGEKFPVPSHRVVVFKPGKKMKEMIEK